MTGPLMTAILADKAASLAYRSEPTMTEPTTEPMSSKEAISLLEDRALRPWTEPMKRAIDLAIAALRAQPEPGPQRDYEADFAILDDLHERLLEKYQALDLQKCEFVSLYRAAEAKLERTWRIVELLQDRLAEEEK